MKQIRLYIVLILGLILPTLSHAYFVVPTTSNLDQFLTDCIDLNRDNGDGYEELCKNQFAQLEAQGAAQE